MESGEDWGARERRCGQWSGEGVESGEDWGAREGRCEQWSGEGAERNGEGGRCVEWSREGGCGGQPSGEDRGGRKRCGQWSGEGGERTGEGGREGVDSGVVRVGRGLGSERRKGVSTWE